MNRDDDTDLAALKAALKAAPDANAKAKAEALSRAMIAFENLGPLSQGSAAQTRSNQDRPIGAGIVNGVRLMLNALKLKPFLAATTSAAALAVGVFVLLPNTQTPRVDLPVLADAPKAPQAPVQDERTAKPMVDQALTRDETPSVAEAAPVLEAPPEAEIGADAMPAPLPAPAPSRALAPLAKTRSLVLPQGGAGMLASGAVQPMDDALVLNPAENTEAFANAPANALKITAQEPVSTFSIDVDTASYSYVRAALNTGFLPPPESVRVEEMVNYFPYAYPAPEAGEAPFKPSVSVLQTPWNPGTKLVQIALQGRMPAIAERPALNLVFLIDTSGSMQDANKLPLLKQSLGLMLGQLRPEDQIAIVAYAGSAGEVLPPTAASERDTILGALDRLEAGGSTAGAEGLELAYKIATRMGSKGKVSRVLLATDGDFNVGVSDPAGLEAYVAKQRDTGVYLSVLGFGRGNLDDAAMQSLAQNGNGTAAYIDTLQEARKVLVDQLTGALFPIANDVKIQVEWNPAQVAEYRLIGYETRALKREDFNNDQVDAGEIGAGTAVTALYEITPVGSDAVLNDPLRYGAATATNNAPELGFLRLRYKAPGESKSALLETPITGQEPPTTEARFAAAIAGFGQLLRGSTYLKDWGWDQAIALALANRGDDDFGYRIEAVNLMRVAQSLSVKR
jgi:Ca-activated chloride channel homolog